MNSTNFVDFFKDISNRDKKRMFNFTSGHLGNLSNPIFFNIIIKDISFLNYLYLLFKILFLLSLSIIPIKNLAFFLRASLRRILNKKLYLHKKFAVISVGGDNAKNDPYLSKILVSLNSKFDYFKIVGGNRLKNSGYFFFEQTFGLIDCLKSFVYIFLVQFLTYFSLLNCIFSKKSSKYKFLYLLSSLDEMISGALYNNYLLNIFGKKISSYNTYKKLIFPMEGRNWEKKLVSHFDKSSTKIIGYVHCAITPRHLSLTNKNFYSETEVPSIVITPSKMSYCLISKVFKSAKVIHGSFIREGRSFGNLLFDKNYIVFALTSSIKESKTIINSIISSKLHFKFRVEIRINPNTNSYGPIKKLIKSNNLNLYSGLMTSKPIVCLFRSSSTAIEYLRLGVNPMYISLNSGFSNNIFDLDNIYKFNRIEIDNFDSFTPTESVYNKNKCMLIANYYLRQSNCLNFIKHINER